MFDQFAELRSAVLEHIDAAVESLKGEGQDKLAEQILCFRDQLSAVRYNIAVLGHMKRGKSTLINALLGQKCDDISPVKAAVCTSALVTYLDEGAAAQFDDSSEPVSPGEAVVFFQDGRPPQRVEHRTLRDFITEDSNPGNRKRVRKVDVCGRFELLNQSVCLVDTPGRGAIEKYHETLVREFLPFADAIVLVVSADLPLEAAEKEFLQELSQVEKRRVFFVLTKKDQLPDDEVSEVREYVTSNVADAGLTCDRLYMVCAKDLFEARARGDSKADIDRIAEASGMRELETDLEQFIVRQSVNSNQVLARVALTLSSLRSHFVAIEAEIAASLGRTTVDEAQLVKEKAQLEEQGADIRKRRDRELAGFARNWDRAVQNFERLMQRRVDPLTDRIVDRLDRGGFLEGFTNAFKIQRLVNRAVADETLDVIEKLQLDLQDIVNRLDNDMEECVEVYGRRGSSKDLVSPVGALVGAGGTAVVATAAWQSASAAVGTALANWAAVSSLPTAGAASSLLAWVAGSEASAPVAAALAAKSAAVTATVGAAATTGVALVGTLIAYKVAKLVTIGLQKNRVPILVAEVIAQGNESIGKALVAERERICALYRDYVDELLISKEQRVADIQKALADDDPELRLRLSEKQAALRRLVERNQLLSDELKLLVQ